MNLTDLKRQITTLKVAVTHLKKVSSENMPTKEDIKNDVKNLHELYTDEHDSLLSKDKNIPKDIKSYLDHMSFKKVFLVWFLLKIKQDKSLTPKDKNGTQFKFMFDTWIEGYLKNKINTKDKMFIKELLRQETDDVKKYTLDALKRTFGLKLIMKNNEQS